MTKPNPPVAAKPPKPEEITSNTPGSFSWGVLHDRHPAIVEQISTALPYPPHIRQALESLRNELDVTVEPLRDDAHDADDWARWGRGYIGETWYDVPFLWAESFFYRKLLEAVDYFHPGPWRSIDPFQPQKSAELRDPTLEVDLELLGELQRLPPEEQITAALDAALWGNRADLGFLLSDPNAAHRKQARALVADDGDKVKDLLAAGGLDTVCLVADNAGRELIPDLVLIDLMLRMSSARIVDLHLKPHPYYVSDATTADLIACLRRLGEADSTRSVAERLSLAAADGRLMISTHPFYCAPLTYHELPADLSKAFANASLVILKGDLNYRRLVGDRHWPATVPFSEAVANISAKLVTLRTLKSDVIVGLSADEVSSLDDEAPNWRTSGAHGLIQMSV